MYTEGESFDKAGMVVTATYSDGTTAPVTGYTYSPSGTLAIGDTAITVGYMEGGIIKIAVTSITVNPMPIMLDSIEMTTPPTKTEYAVGEDFDPSGMEVTAHYTNGGADRVLDTNEYTIDPVDMTTPGMKNVVIRHVDHDIEKTHSFAVTVTEALQPSPEPTGPSETVDPGSTTTTDPEPEATVSQSAAADTQATDGGSSDTDEAMPKTGVEDSRLLMSAILIMAGLAAFILLVQAAKQKKEEDGKY